MPGNSPPHAPTVHILGAGLAGLAAGADLVQAGRRVRVLEADVRVGGLAQSFDFHGYACDFGPHRFHSNQQAILDHIKGALGDNIHTRERLSRIYLFRKFFYYPLRATNIIGLPKLVLLRAFLDYCRMRVQLWFKDIPDDHFENYVRKRFGNTLYRIFFGTYTEKTWQIPASQISADWAGQRITLLNLWDVIKKTLFKPKVAPRTIVAQFHYPKHGGVGAISEGYADLIRAQGNEILLQSRVTRFHHDGKRITQLTFEGPDGAVTEACEQVVSTLPVNRLVERLEPRAPDDILEAAARLKHKAILFVYLELDREKVTDDHWVYLPEAHLKVHRISEFKNFSEHTCPPGKTLLCAEITCSRDDETWSLDDEALVEVAVKDLSGIGLFRREEVGRTTVKKVPYAYPLYDLDYRKNLQILVRYLRRFENLISTGRQGLFRYGNMDHSVAMGARVARNLATGEGPTHDEVAADAAESFESFTDDEGPESPEGKDHERPAQP